MSIHLFTAGFLAVVMLACAPAHDAASTPLLDTEWRLIEIEGRRSIQTTGERQPHVRFLREGNRVEGFSGCNSFSGTYELNGTHLRITGPMMMTKRACAQSDLNTQESRFIAALTATTTYTITAQVGVRSGKATYGKQFVETSTRGILFAAHGTVFGHRCLYLSRKCEPSSPLQPS